MFERGPHRFDGGLTEYHKGENLMGVKVKIFGQEYNIAGDKSAEDIQKLAEYVDEKMRLIARMTDASGGGVVQVMTAINIAEEYFDAMQKIEDLQDEIAKSGKDSQNYVKMLEDSKNAQSKVKESMDQLQKDREEERKEYKELEKKCTDYENTIFDLQMENIQLKSELEKINKH